MIEEKIMLDELQKVNAFVSLAMSKSYDIDLISGKYLVNAKSIMGIFSLDLTEPLTVKADADDPEFLEEIKVYKVED